MKLGISLRIVPRFVAVCLFIGGASPLRAQASNQPWQIGVSGGVNLSQISGGGSSDISNRTAGSGGVYAVIPISDGWSLQTGALLSMKGWQRDEPGTHDLTVARLTYVELPLLLRYDAAINDKAGGFLYAGPGFGFRTGCSIAETTHSTGQTASLTCDAIASASSGTLTFKSFDPGAIGGVGLRFDVGRAAVVATAQYELGLSTISNALNAKNRTASFGLGIEVPIHRK